MPLLVKTLFTFVYLYVFGSVLYNLFNTIRLGQEAFFGSISAFGFTSLFLTPLFAVCFFAQGFFDKKFWIALIILILLTSLLFFITIPNYYQIILTCLYYGFYSTVGLFLTWQQVSLPSDVSK